MTPSSISFLADCPKCGSKVQTTTKLARTDLMDVLDRDGEVWVVHFTPSGGDHEWTLTTQQKANLRKQIANGLV